MKKNRTQLYLGNQETEMQNTVDHIDWQRFYLKNSWVINVQQNVLGRYKCENEHKNLIGMAFDIFGV